MKKFIKRGVVFVLVLGVAGLVAKGSSKEDAKSMAAMLKAAFSKEGFWGEIKPSKNPVAEVNSTEPLPETVSAKGVKESLALFAHAFYIKKSFDEAEVEPDSFLLPNSRFARISVRWLSVKSSSGKEVMAAGFKNKENFVNGTLRIPLSGLGDGEVPVEAGGVARISLPVKYIVIEIQPDQKGKTVSKGDYKVKLNALSNDIYQVSLSDKKRRDLTNKKIVVLPFGVYGRLKIKESTEGPVIEKMPDIVARAIQDLESGKRSADQVGADLQRHKDELEKSVDKSAKVFSGRGTGKIHLLKVFIPVENMETQLKIMATAEPKTTEESQETARFARYAKPVPLNYQKLSLEQLKKAIKIVSKRSEAIFGFNTPEVACFFPRISNSAYGSIDFKDVKLRDKARHDIEYEAELSGFMEDSNSSEIRFLPASGQKTVTFDKAAGSVHIKYPLSLKTLSVKKGENSKLVQFDKRVIRYKTEGVAKAESLFAKLRPVRAYDASGRQLYQLGFSGFYSIGDGEFEALAFWGEPVRVEIDVVEQWAEFDMPFELAPADLLPASNGNL